MRIERKKWLKLSSEMGALTKLSVNVSRAAGAGHIKAFIVTQRASKFEHPLREDAPDEYIIREPIEYVD